MAEHFFRGNDDLTVDLPARDDRPGIQRWDTTNNGQTPLARQWNGDYSWIVSVVPTTNAARDGMAHGPEGFAYDVSVVVFYKRASRRLCLKRRNDSHGGRLAYERMVERHEHHLPQD